MDRILGDFHVAALKAYANNPDDFNLEEFIKEYTGTPIFKMRVRPEISGAYDDLIDWLIKNKRIVFIESDISKDDKKAILNSLGYSDNMLEE